MSGTAMAGAVGPGRARNPALVRLVLAHLASVVAEYGALVAVLVFAFDEGGSGATGRVSLAVLAAGLGGAASAAALTNRFRPLLVRRAGLAAQLAGYGLAAVGAAVGSLPLVTVAAVVAFAALATLRPTGAVLLPSVVRNSRELTVGNLWISRCESVSALAGPLGVAALLWAGGPTAALAGCALAVTAALTASLPGSGEGPPPSRVQRPLATVVTAVRASRGTVGLLGVSAARYAILGALDVLLVVLAYESLDLGSGGVGVLNALLGVGALASMGVVSLVVRRSRLAPSLAIGMVLAGLLFVALAAATSRPVAFVAVPLIGLLAALFDGLGRMLLQRSTDPRSLASLFALVELVGGAAMLVGSGLAQLLIAVGDVHLALAGVAVLLAVILALAARPVWHGDATADVPVVEMSLLHTLPMFAPLAPVALEALARTAVYEEYSAGAVVVRQGEPGDRFYAVAGGCFSVVMSGERIRVVERGSSFGEVALLADVPRTATVTATVGGEVLTVDRVAFLVAVTGSDTSRAAAWGVVRALDVDPAILAKGDGTGDGTSNITPGPPPPR